MTEQTIPIPPDTQYFTPDKPFRLECGAEIPLRIAYHTYGTYTGDNVLWVCHALTANSEVADWWPHTVEKGKFLDPERWFTVCANIIGSCYGTTGPTSINPATGEPYYDSFPLVTVRDMARAHLLLADHLGIRQAQAIIGSSIGGFQALEETGMYLVEMQHEVFLGLFGVEIVLDEPVYFAGFLEVFRQLFCQILDLLQDLVLVGNQKGVGCDFPCLGIYLFLMPFGL